MSRKKVNADHPYEFFVEPGNQPTNEICSQSLNELDYIEGLIDTNKAKHNVWRCSLEFIKCLMESRTAQPQIVFRSFTRQVYDNVITEFTFVPDKSPRKTANAKISKQLSKIIKLQLQPAI